MKLVRGVGRDVDCLACLDLRLMAAECGQQFSFEHDEGLLEVVAVGWRAAAGRGVHVDQAESAGGVLGGQQGSVGIAHQADVGEIGVFGAHDDEFPARVVGRDGILRLRFVRVLRHGNLPVLYRTVANPANAAI